MRVALLDTVLSRPQDWIALDELVGILATGQHLWDISDFDAVRGSRWLTHEDSRATRRNIELLEKCFTDSAYHATTDKAHAIRLEVTLTTSGPLALSAADALVACRDAAYIVVENADSDGAFLDALFAAFDKPFIATSRAKLWLRIEHAGGGGGLRATTERLLARNIPGPRRILVLRDSDRMHPDADLGNDVRNLVAWCQSEGITCHVLSKRETENYLPVDALAPASAVPAERVTRAKPYQGFIALSQRQRDYFDIKKGFGEGDANTIVIHESHRDLYAGVNQSVLSNLRGGFGDNVHTRFASYKATAEELVATCPNHPDELPQLLTRIEEML